MADDLGIGLGAGLSGFAKGFASSFVTGTELKQQQQLEERKNMREMLVKHVLDPSNPIDLTTDTDPTTKRMVTETFGHAAPLFEKLSARNSEHVYQTRMQAQQAAAAPLEPGEKRTVKTPYGSETRAGAAIPKPGSTPEEKIDLARKKTQATEEVKEPFRKEAETRRMGREQRAEQRRLRAENRAERRQFRSEARKAAIKFSADPKTRSWGQTIKNWINGTNPDQRLNEALAGIPTEALPPALQQKQAEGAQGAAPSAGGTTAGRVSWKVVP